MKREPARCPHRPRSDDGGGDKETMISNFIRIVLGIAVLAVAAWPAAGGAADLVETIKTIKPGIVGVGVHDPLARPVNRLAGTGFAVMDGNHAVTNLHVVRDKVKPGERAKLAVFVGEGRKIDARPAEVVAEDARHDMAVLAFDGPALKPLPMNGSKVIEEGTDIAFTGFPIGAVYGLHPVTHRGMVSAVTPIVIPQASSRNLDPEMVRRLKDPFNVFQLDATAYPGNSGSPVFEGKTGEVIAVISSVFVKESKENILEDPSGITFAIPIQYALRLLNDLDTKPVPE